MFQPKELEIYRYYLEDLISISEGARLKGVNESSLRKAIKTKRLKIAKKVGTTHLCSRREVLEMTIVGHRPKKVRDTFCQEDR